MSRFARFAPVVFAMAAVVVPGAMAFAADLREPLPPLPEIEPAQPIPVGGGWYLRGDVGVGLGLRGVKNVRPMSIQTATGAMPIDEAVVRARIDNGWSISGGVGYRFNQNLRADVTAIALSGVRMHAIGVDQAFASGASQAVGYYSAGTRSNVALANVYWDIIDLNGFTPYLGAGFGVAYNRVYKVARYEQSQPYAAPTDFMTARHGGHASAAFALYAGFSYEVAPGVKADIGYRYLRAGQGRSGRAACGESFGCVEATPLRIKGIDSHDVTAGVRWELASY